MYNFHHEMVLVHGHCALTQKVYILTQDTTGLYLYLSDAVWCPLSVGSMSNPILLTLKLRSSFTNKTHQKDGVLALLNRSTAYELL